MHISEFNHLRDHPFVRVKTEHVKRQEFTILSYMIADSDFWMIPLARECRGITFNSDGECVSRPFAKFFNMNELPETKLDVIREIPIIGIYEKRDGSMITGIVVNGKVYFKSKKSFHSDVAKIANELASDEIRRFTFDCCREGLTPIYELTTIENQIVIAYPESDPPLTLLAIRNNATGIELLWKDVTDLAYKYEIPLISSAPQSLDSLCNDALILRGIEGWVLKLETGDRIKLKTEWYLVAHRIMTDFSERFIAELVIDGKFDDLKAAAISKGLDLAPMLKIESRVLNELAILHDSVKSIVKLYHDAACLKDAVLKMQSHHPRLFPLLIREFKGQRVNYQKFWKDHYYDQYSTRSVYNSMF